jgi:hypothetical protein
MTNDRGDEIRDRFRATPLPPAPVRLRERLASVASSPRITKPRFGRARLVLSFVAVLAIASIGLVAGGGMDDPGPSPSALTAEATAEATAETTPETTVEPLPFQVVCEEAAAPALTCDEIVDRVLSLSEGYADSEGRMLEIQVVRPTCDAGSPCPTEPRSVGSTVTFASGYYVLIGIGPNGLFQMLVPPETDAPPPDGATDNLD